MATTSNAVAVGDLSDDETLALYEVVHYAGLAWTLDDARIVAANHLVNDGLARREEWRVGGDGEDLVRFWPTDAGRALWGAGAFERAHELLAERGDTCGCCTVPDRAPARAVRW